MWARENPVRKCKMIKHSKGKHAAGGAQPAQAAQKDGDAAAEKAAAATQSASEGQDPETGVRDGADADAEHDAAAEEAEQSDADDRAATDAADGCGEGDAQTGAANGASDDEASAAPGTGATDAPPAHAAPDVSIPSKRVRMRRALIATGSAVAAVAAAYLIGVGVFSFCSMPNTTIVGMDFSLMTPESMQEKLDSTLGEHEFSVVGKRMNFHVTSEEAGVACDTAAVAQAVMDSEDAWCWPAEVFQSHDRTDTFTELLHADELDAVVDAQAETVNADAVQPVNATAAFSEEDGCFVGVPEVKGTAIDPQALKEAILAGILRLDDKVVLTDEVLVQPTILLDDPRIKAAVDQANEYTKADFDVTMGDALVAHVGPALTAQWVSVSPELEVAFDEGALSAWASEVSDGCNTVGTTRTYTRPDGKQASVTGGTYGWRIDDDALASQVVEAVKAGSTAPLAAPVLQSGTGFTGLGGQDWGARYIDVDLSEQYARYYDNGQVIWESVIVSGNPNKGDATPTGVYTGNTKLTNTVLRGRIQKDGKPEYESPVKYWMPFVGNSIGFHDASWQAAYGGSRYLTNGSRGCINLPYDAASSLFGLFSTGDVVVVHY